MKIEVRGSNVPISDALAAHIARKLDFALRRFEAGVETVIVRLVDLNGPKGGRDKRCRIVATLSASRPIVVVDAMDADAYVAVSQAAGRLEERVARALQRERSHVAPRKSGYVQPRAFRASSSGGP